MNEIDIVDIKKEVINGNLRFYLKDKKIYLANSIGEVVKVGEIDKEEN